MQLLRFAILCCISFFFSSCISFGDKTKCESIEDCPVSSDDHCMAVCNLTTNTCEEECY